MQSITRGFVARAKTKIFDKKSIVENWINS